ncbi:MAG: sce7726 family protein [Eubacterium sp.]
MLKDKDIREPLFDYLEDIHAKIRIIEEKTMGKSRADVIMVLESEIVGIEIKSDADTYARLSRQVKDYDRYFDRNIVVVGSRHAHHIGEHVPEWWGIISVEEIDGLCDFYIVREAAPNPKCKLLHKTKLLWRPEIAHIQELNDLPAYRQKSKDFVRKKILEKVPEEILHKQISDELFERDYTTIQQKIDSYKKK